MSFRPGFITLPDLFIAYRKAKREAYSDTNCAHGRKFARYERDLVRNLRHLLRRLRDAEPTWPTRLEFLGRPTCIAKEVEPVKPPEGHFYDSDPLKGWRRQHRNKQATAKFRPVIDASVDFQIIAVLWVLKVGHRYDAALNPDCSLGNRLYRRRAAKDGGVGEVNLDRQELFQPYFRAYRRWREEGFAAMKRELGDDKGRVIGVTMDLKQFYHRIDAKFLLAKGYLASLGLELSKDERLFTERLLQAIDTWNEAASARFGGEAIGLPVGLTASSVIANVLLRDFDNAVKSKVRPLHYGRYVDDIFLVLQDRDRFENKEELMQWLGGRLGPLTSYEPTNGGSLRLQLPYAPRSLLCFVGEKQKVFRLAGKRGLDLLRPIEEQIKRQNSEFRELPQLPKSEEEMAARALLATPDATLEADSLRKADAVILRRAGFARLLGAVEKYAQDLPPNEWEKLRHNFYGLANRQVVTPQGFFNYARYLPRIVALMASTDDIDAAIVLIRGLARVVRTLKKTCRVPSGGTFEECTWTLTQRLVEAVLTTRTQERTRSPVVRLLQALKKYLDPELKVPRTEKRVRLEGERLFLADWAKRPYGTAWLEERVSPRQPPPLPRPEIRELLRWGTFRRLQRWAGIDGAPHWPGLCFPTRRIALSTLTAYVPRLLTDYSFLREVSLALRGAWMPDLPVVELDEGQSHRPPVVRVNAPRREDLHVAVTSIRTEDASWDAAVRGTPALTRTRYERMNALFNQILRQPTRPNYVLLPECSLPRRWARSLSLKLSVNGISLIAGLEYRHLKHGLRNEALVSLVADFRTYRSHITLLQAKLAPAWEEKSRLAKAGQTLLPPGKGDLRLPVYRHGQLDFGVLICSDLTNLRNRHHFQGEIDCLFVPEWNPDVETFSALVEAGAQDLHAYVVQANNLLFGDSRIRVPRKVSYERDVVRVRGGTDDYAVTGKIVPHELRTYQSTPVPDQSDQATFKPYSIGFRCAKRRRMLTC